MADSEPHIGEAGGGRPRSGPGRLLRDQRLRRELGVGDVADGLHLDARTIDALERDDYSELPPVTFVRGYLRAYARLLELPDEEVLQRFDALGVSDSTRPLTPSVGEAGAGARTKPTPAPTSRRGGGGLLVVSLALVLLIGGVGGGAWLLQQRDWSLPALSGLLGEEPAGEESAGGEDASDDIPLESSQSSADGGAADEEELPAAATPPEGDGDAGAEVGAGASEPTGGAGGVSASDGAPDAAAEGSGGAETPVFDPELVQPPEATDGENDTAGDDRDTDAEADTASGATAGTDGEGGPAGNGLGDQAARVRDATDRVAPPAPETGSSPAGGPAGGSVASTPTLGEDVPGLPEDAPETAAVDDAGETAGETGGGGSETAATETLRFRFSGESWMEVRDASGERLLFGLEDGGTREVEGVPPFEIVIGDTENVALEREGESVSLADYARDRVARFTLGSP